MNRLDWVEESTQSVWIFLEHWKMSVLEEKNVVLNQNSIEGKPCINRESKILELKN